MGDEEDQTGVVTVARFDEGEILEVNCRFSARFRTERHVAWTAFSELGKKCFLQCPSVVCASK